MGLSITVEALPQLDALTARFPDEALALAAGGGEDYALLCTAPPALDRALRALGGVRIGEVTEGRGVTLLRHGRPLPPPSSCGFDHFA
ncbi:MAG: hypothetical protein D6682_03275 [Zetaproteobacteria bacterium]|nr:MAG: hypothetical protein D6682_03275 [Zetaproteobacteria bacterium]